MDSSMNVTTSCSLWILEVNDKPAHNLLWRTGNKQLVVDGRTEKLLAKEASDVHEHFPVAALDR